MPLLWPRLAETINKINEIQSLNGQPRTYHSCLISKGEASFISIKAVPRTGIRKSPLEVHTSGMRLELLALITVERKCLLSADPIFAWKTETTECRKRPSTSVDAAGACA